MALLLLLLPSVAMAQAAPTLSDPIPSIYVSAGTSFYGALNLSHHFVAANAERLTFRVAAVGGQPSDQWPTFSVAVRGDLLDVVAPTAAWTGKGSFMVSACSAGAPADCTESNPFDVTITAPASGGGSGPAPVFGILGLPVDGAVAPGATIFVELEAPNGTVPQSVTWFLDGTPVGEGPTLSLSSLGAGDHILEVRGSSPGAPLLVRRGLSVGAPPMAPVSGGAFSPWMLGLGAFVVVGAVLVGSARSRGPLLLLALGVVARRAPRDSPLDHFTRGSLYQLVRDNPGIHFSELRRRTGISHGTCIHHLRVLEDAGYVHSKPVGPRTRFYNTSRVPQERTFGLSETDETVLLLVHNKPGISLLQIVATTRKSRGTISKSVSKLTHLGYVTVGRTLRQRTVFPRPGIELPDGLRPEPQPMNAEGGPTQ